jgi:hypothetical protein
MKIVIDNRQNNSPALALFRKKDGGEPSKMNYSFRNRANAGR